MKIRTKEIYNCEHCNKLYLRKKSCETHEKYCMKNEANIPKCFGCLFIKEHKNTSHYDGQEYFYEPKHFECTKKDVVMHPMSLQGKIDRGVIFNHALVTEFLEETESELMPKECEDFEAEDVGILSFLNPQFTETNPNL